MCTVKLQINKNSRNFDHRQLIIKLLVLDNGAYIVKETICSLVVECPVDCLKKFDLQLQATGQDFTYIRQ